MVRDLGQLEEVEALAERGGLLYRQAGSPESAAQLMVRAAKLLEMKDPGKAVGLYQKVRGNPVSWPGSTMKIFPHYKNIPGSRHCGHGGPPERGWPAPGAGRQALREVRPTGPGSGTAGDNSQSALQLWRKCERQSLRQTRPRLRLGPGETGRLRGSQQGERRGRREVTEDD